MGFVLYNRSNAVFCGVMFVCFCLFCLRGLDCLVWFCFLFLYFDLVQFAGYEFAITLVFRLVLAFVV